MKINLNHAVALTVALVTGAMSFTSCTSDIEVDKNVDPAGNAISFATSVGHTTRATETKQGNLGNFAVVARGMHHDGVLYDSYLIGSSTGGDIARREGNSNTWKLDHNVYWPATLNKVLFYAYTALNSNDGDKTDVLGTGPVLGFEGDNPYIDNFKPLKATAPENNLQADGKDQDDLLVAYTPQKKSHSETNVNLNFKHALTQISINAKQTGKLDNDHRIVRIKGAWIVNAAASGKLTAKSTKSMEGTEYVYTYEDSWTPTGTDTYGSVWKDVVQLDKDNSSDLLRGISLMLIPQNLTAWDWEHDKTNSNKGAYILLLCRVELVHDGSTHPGANLDDIGIEGDKHLHQLFPVNTEKYDGTQYGFACVPLSSLWNDEGIGKHYTYNLNICGNGTGAGKYPPAAEAAALASLVPADSFGISVVLNDPGVTGKTAGDNVLDEPIQFTVDVDPWETSGDWTPGDIDF